MSKKRRKKSGNKLAPSKKVRRKVKRVQIMSEDELIKIRKKAKKAGTRVSPMLGRRPSEENRGKDAPKLGRKYRNGEEAERHVVSLSLKNGSMKKLLKKLGTEKKALAIAELIENNI